MYGIRQTKLQILRIIRLEELINFHRLKFYATRRREIIGRMLEIKAVQLLLLTERQVHIVIKLSLSFEKMNFYSRSSNVYVCTYIFSLKQILISS